MHSRSPLGSIVAADVAAIDAVDIDAVTVVIAGRSTIDCIGGANKLNLIFSYCISTRESIIFEIPDAMIGFATASYREVQGLTEGHVNSVSTVVRG